MTDCLTDIDAGIVCTLAECDQHPGHPGQGHDPDDLEAGQGGVSDPDQAYRFADYAPKCCSRDTRDWLYGEPGVKECEDCP